MATRLPASQHTREELTALIEGRLSTASAKDELVKLATRLIVEEALEGEAGDALGREYYEHGAQPGQGYRNGYRPGRLKTAEGRMEYSAPQIAGRDEPFRSAIREHLKGHTQGLEDLAIEMLARGLSVRDIEDAFKDETGRLLLSKTAVSQLGERLWEDYRAFTQRDLSEYEITYLFVDGIAERLRPGAKREPVLAAWGFTIEGRRVLLHMMAGSKEDAETVIGEFWHPVIGAVIFATIGLFVPRALGVGYDAIGDVLSNSLAVGTVAVSRWPSCSPGGPRSGSGTSGGTLAPILLISAGYGSLFGAAFVHLFPGLDVRPGAFAVVAMAATFGAATPRHVHRDGVRLRADTRLRRHPAADARHGRRRPRRGRADARQHHDREADAPGTARPHRLRGRSLPHRAHLRDHDDDCRHTAGDRDRRRRAPRTS